MDHSHQHFHDRMVELVARQQGSVSTDGGTVFSVVYVTAEPTFTGVIGGYTTLTDDDSAPTAAESSLNPAAATAQGSSPTVEASTAAPETIVGQDPTSSASFQGPATTGASSTAFSAGNTNSGAVAAASATSGASSGSSSSSSDGMSTGAKAGIAIGVIAVVGLIAVFLLWLLGKKRREREAQAKGDNEKSTNAAAAPATEMALRSPPISATAPRISLRPVSRMMPEFFGNSNKARLSGGNLLTTIGESNAPSSRNLSPSPQPRGPSPTPKRIQDSHPSNPFADPQNPFADPEKPIQAPAPLAIAPAITKSAPAPAPAPVAPIVAAASLAPLASPASSVVAKPTPAPTAAPVVAPAMAAVSVPAPKPAPQQAPPLAPQPEPQSAPPSAPSTPVTPAPVVATGPGPESPQGSVFRVLMDFAPSMEDELELRTGQLVRLLHEYDDGWALCIRLDRSQQGVVPRTCLAAKPSKPKPSHLNQYARPPPPGQTSRPMSPAGGPRSGMGPPRPMSPAGRPMSPAGARRPMSPAGAGRRPMSPAGAGRRPMSPASRAGSPNMFNQAPRPLSPGPRPQQPYRSNSPGPYGGRGAPPPMAGSNRPRSNSASNVRDRRNSPVGPSKLGPGSGFAL